jgi:ATP-dependent DNA helicase RecG
MAQRHVPGSQPGARELTALLAPLRFAARQDGAGLERLAGLGDTVRGAIGLARRSGAPESPALSRLAAEAEAFDGLPSAERLSALCRMAAELGSLVTLPADLGALARRGQIPATPPTRATSKVPASPPDAASPEDRAGRRARLATPLANVPGAHHAPRALLEERGRVTVEGALEFWPKGWQDRTHVRRVADLQTGEPGIAVVTVRTVRQQRMRNGKPMLKVATADGTSRLELVFFNPPPWRHKQFQAGETILVSGDLTEGYGGVRQMAQPEVEKVTEGDSANFGRIVPIYVGPADHQHPALRKLMKRLVDEWAPFAADDLPPEVRMRRRLLGRAEALAQAHFPSPGTNPSAAWSSRSSSSSSWRWR